MKLHYVVLFAIVTLVAGTVAGIFAARSCWWDLRYDGTDGKPLVTFRGAVDCTMRLEPTE